VTEPGKDGRKFSKVPVTFDLFPPLGVTFFFLTSNHSHILLTEKNSLFFNIAYNLHSERPTIIKRPRMPQNDIRTIEHVVNPGYDFS